MSWLPGWLRQRFPDLRTVTTFHDLRVPYLFPKAGRLREAVRDRLVRGSDAAVFTDRDDWAAAGAARRRGRYWIPIGSNLAVDPPAGYDRQRWRAHAGADDATFLVVHLGFLNRSKGLETLLDAMVRLRGQGRRARLLLVGAEVGASDPANRAYAAELERRLGVLALSGLVERLPLVPPALASAYLLAADAADHDGLVTTAGASSTAGLLCPRRAQLRCWVHRRDIHAALLHARQPQPPGPLADSRLGCDLRFTPIHGKLARANSPAAVLSAAEIQEMFPACRGQPC